LSPAAGSYKGTQSVTITDAAKGTSIYYTTDGTAPTNQSNLYSSPIKVTASETLEAIATAKGYRPSAVASAAYTIIPLPVPAITWATPAAIAYGTPLSATQLNATSTVKGAFTYSPPSGTVLGVGVQTLSASFTPSDATNYATAAASVTVKVNPAAPAITWAKPAGITYGTALSATQLNAASKAAGAFVYSPQSGTVLDAGTQTLTATFTPTDTNDYTMASANVTLTVNKAAQTITFTVPSTPVTYGAAPIALAATASSGLAVSFAVTSGPATVIGSTLTITGAGSVVVAANQPGNGNYSAATAVSKTITVSKASSAVSLGSSTSSTTYGTQITLTATLTGAANSAQPTGTVTFLSGTTSLGTGTVNANGAAALTTAALPVGNDSITASYGGDSNYATAKSSATSVTVGKGAQTITFTVPVSQVTYGVAPIALAATSTSGLAVTFTVASGSPATVSGSTLTITGVGTVTINANQAGNTSYSAAAAVQQTITVNPGTATGKLTSSAASVTYGTSVTLTATFTGSGSARPSGTVTFYNNVTTPVGTAALNAGGVATLALATLPVGTDSLTASFAPDAHYAAATSPAISETVKQAAPTVKLTTSATSAAFGASVTLTATLTGAGAKPTGSVTFANGSTTLGTGPVALNSSGVATLTPTTLPVGADSIKASYTGDTNYAAATSTAATVTIGKATPTIGLTSSATSIAKGSSVTFTATLTGPVATAPSGTVNFLDGTATLGTGTLNSGVAAYSTSNLTTGKHNITAKYAGDGNYLTVTSSVTSITITAAVN